MPDVKVCLWNIQNFGQQSGKYDGRTYNNALRNRFIAAFVHQHDIDVLMIQEVTSAPQNALEDLRTRLNAPYPNVNKDWAYSWCGCAVINGDVDSVTSAADLTDRTGARTESYGVMWRRRQNARFTMIQALNDISSGTGPAIAVSPLNISQYGRPTGNVEVEMGQETFGATGGFTLANPYPYELDPDRNRYDLLDHWPKLNYPPTSNKDIRGIRWWGARRPAYVVIKLNDNDDNLCPIAAYHAPSNQQRSSWGAYIAGLAREVYVVDKVDGHNRPIADDPEVYDIGMVGGDFNLSVNAGEWPGDYSYFVDARRQNYDGGANRLEVPPHTATDALRRTTVQIVTGEGHDTPIVGPNNSDYLRYKIDLAFYPRNAGITAERIDLLNEIRNNPGNVYDNCLVQTEDYMDFVEQQIANPFNPTPQRLTATGPQRQVTKKRGRRTYTEWVPIISGAWGGTFINWAETRRQFAAHNITDARRAAEYIHIFVSDHLPLVVTIPI